jgi:hypothetical protein
MKLRINFVNPAESVRLGLLYSGWILAVLFVCSAVYMVFDGVYMKAHRQDDLKELADKGKEFSGLKEPGNMPSPGDIIQLKRRAGEINSLKINKSPGLSLILRRIEELAPDGVYFTRFEYSLDDSSIQFLASAPSAGVIPGFLRNMENDGTFRAVILEKQSVSDSITGGQSTMFAVKAEESNR